MVIGKRNIASDKMCPCCTLYVDKSPLDINCDTKDLSFLGSGIPLYLDFLRGCIIILLIFFVTSGDYNIITNYQYGKDCIGDDDCPAIVVSYIFYLNSQIY